MIFQILKVGGSVYYGKDVDFTWNGTEIHYSDGVRLLYYQNPANTTYLMYSVVDGVWSFVYEEAYDPYCVNIGVPDDFFENIVWCNFDLYSSGSSNLCDSGSVLVFQKTPVEEKTLALIMKKTPLEEVMKEILEILPVVLMTIVGLISLRKALQILSRVLHRS